MSNYKKKIFHGSGALFVSSIISMVGGIFLSGFVVRLLTHYEAGVWFTFWTLTVILAFCDFGLSPTLSREIALASYKKNIKFRVENLYSTVTKANYMLLLLAFVAVVVFYFVFLGREGRPDFYEIIKSYFIFSIAIGFRLLANPPLSVVYGVGEVATQTIILTFSSLLGFLLGIGALALGYGLVGLTFAFLVAYFALYIVAKFYVHFNLGYQPRYSFSRLVLRRLFPVAMNWSLMEIGAILLVQLPSLIIVAVMGPAALTPFAIIRQVCSSILSFSILIGKATMPFISQSVGQNNTELLNVLFSFVVKFTTGVALFLALYIFALNDEIAHVWFGSQLQFNEVVLLIMLIAAVIESHSIAATQCCLSAGYIQFAKMALLSGLLVLILTFIFISLWGLVGVAVAILLTQLLTNSWYSLYVSFKRVQVSLRIYLKLLSEVTLMGLWMAVVLILVHYLLNPFFDGHPVSTLIVDLVTLIVLSFLGLLAFKSDRDFFLSALHRNE